MGDKTTATAALLVVLLAGPAFGQGDLIFADGFEFGTTSAWSLTVPDWWRPAPGTSWQWQLTGAIDTSIDVEMYDIDLFDTPTATIDAAARRGRT